MFKQVDLLIVGAGLSGCVIAERAARLLNWKVLIVERRNHIAGNCYDRYGENGVLVHQYGPHYFRSNKLELVGYLSQFTQWIDGQYYVKSSYQGDLYSFPINLNTLEQFFKHSLDSDKAKELLRGERLDIRNPSNSEELVLSRVGQRLYEAFYLNYTLKQWDKHPKELDTSVCGRIPVRFNRDDRYVEHQYQMMPKDGYTAMIQKMISHPNIHLLLNTNYRDLDLSGCKAVVHTGAIDEYFNYSLGKLPWRSLSFKFQEVDAEYVQPCVQINYPNDHDYTRCVEIKHVTGQQHPKSTLVYEYPTKQGDPYYPIPAPENTALYEKYKALAEKETIENNVYFAGRLAQYAYLNMDEVIEQALCIFEKIKKDKQHKSDEQSDEDAA